MAGWGVIEGVWGGGIWEEGAGEVIGRSWDRVLDAESIRGWGKCWKYQDSMSTRGLVRESRDS